MEVSSTRSWVFFFFFIFYVHSFYTMQVFSSFIIIFNYNASQQHYESGFFPIYLCVHSFCNFILFFNSQEQFYITASGLISIPSR